MDYVSLHHHSTFSYGDGFGTPKQHVERAVELGCSALALTEHGNTSSHVQLEKAAKANGIKPIFGLEAYTAPSDMRETQNQRKWHLTILAETANGYRNLNRLVSRSWADGFYRWPTVTGPMLADHADGLVVLSGCSDSLLACTLLGGKGIPEPDKPNIRGALGVIERFKQLFAGAYFIEVQQFPELERTRQINKLFAGLARQSGVELVATGDCHYPRPEDNEMQKILHAASRNTGTVAAAEAEWEYNIKLTLPESDEVVMNRLVQTGLTYDEAGRAVETTTEIANRCTVTLPKSETIKYPGTELDLLPWE